MHRTATWSLELSRFSPASVTYPIGGEFSDNLPPISVLLYDRFTGNLKINSITVIGGEDGGSPVVMKAFKNRDDLDFSMAEQLKPVQEWTLVEDFEGRLPYETRSVEQGATSSFK